MQLLDGENQVPVLSPDNVTVLDGEAAALGFAASLVEELARVEALMMYLFISDYTNFTIQSMQIGLPLTSSMKTLAGCMSSNAMRSEI